MGMLMAKIAIRAMAAGGANVRATPRAKTDDEPLRASSPPATRAADPVAKSGAFTNGATMPGGILLQSFGGKNGRR